MGDVVASVCSKVLNIVVEVIQDHGLRIEKINIIIGKCGCGRAVVRGGCKFFRLNIVLKVSFGIIYIISFFLCFFNDKTKIRPKKFGRIVWISKWNYLLSLIAA